jgi:uncharacterized protein YgbK (DUF1537 family)
MPLRKCRILAIADDMTGALEVGATLAEFGSVVTTATEPDFGRDQQVIVIDTETRHFFSTEAAARIYSIAYAARRLQVDILYKKTDSTLRGNIGPEINALARAYPERPIVFVPAYPRLGRTLRRGHLHVDGEPVHRTAFGQDALNPVETSYVPELVSDGEVPLHLVDTATRAGRLQPGHVYIYDSETDTDVAAVMELALAESPLPVFCGPCSVASRLAAALGGSDAPVPLPLVTRAVVVNGSRHERSEQQVQFARERGWPILSPQELLSNPLRPEWTILDVDAPANRLGVIVRDVLRTMRLDCLVVFGGDTTYSILRSLGASTVIPVCELLPGIPVSRVGHLQLVTKAGGFGPVDVLPQIRERLSGGR